MTTVADPIRCITSPAHNATAMNMSDAIKTYKIFTLPEHEIKMVQAIQELKIKGIMWPNSNEPRFDLQITEDTLLVLKLKIPFVKYVMA